MKKPVENKNYAENLVKMQLAEAAKAPEEMDADFVLECAEAALELQGIDYELSAEEIKAKVAAIPFKTADGKKPQKRVRSIEARRLMAIAAALAGLLMISCIYAIAQDKTAVELPTEFVTDDPYEVLREFKFDPGDDNLTQEEYDEKYADYVYRYKAAETEIETGIRNSGQLIGSSDKICVVFDSAITYTPPNAKFYDTLEEAVKGENLDIIYPTELPKRVFPIKLTADSSCVGIAWFNPYSLGFGYEMYVRYSMQVPECDMLDNATVFEIGGVKCYEHTQGDSESSYAVIAFEYNGDYYQVVGQKLEIVESLVESMLNGVTEQN